ncbi:MAG: lycopene beta-cyclase CrtY [Deltaproteobacteria bacterium]|nr:lycopene beta-cyclase CrtY [Deltaproteobacteria bacterium]
MNDAMQGGDATPFDFLLLGGGLQACLIILAVRQRQPMASIAVIEAGERLAGNHTWCLHDGDVTGPAREWLWPALSARWPGYTVRFPGYLRSVPLSYSAVTSQDLGERAAAALRQGPHDLRLATTGQVLDDHRVQLGTGEVLRGRRLVVATGRADMPRNLGGWQTFLGIELVTPRPHGLQQPILMDATVAQVGGFRFLYVLPLAPDRLLVEDTCFADAPDLNLAERRQGVLAYAERHDWLPAAEVRCETGVLPMPWRLPPQPATNHVRAGVAGGWFHPLTGYSLPWAAAVAEHLAQRDPGEPLGDGWRALQQQHRRQQRLPLLLNWALFRMAEPAARTAMLDLFYRRDASTIGRIYALRHTWRDTLALFAGRPPRGMARWPRRWPLTPALEAPQ